MLKYIQETTIPIYIFKYLLIILHHYRQSMKIGPVVFISRNDNLGRHLIHLCGVAIQPFEHLVRNLVHMDYFCVCWWCVCLGATLSHFR